MTVADDLATLRGVMADCQDVLSAPDVDRGMAALGRVEAEIARLRSQRDDLGSKVEYWIERHDEKERRAEAAEAEVARLQDEIQREYVLESTHHAITERLHRENERLRDGLATILHRAETRRVAVKMDGSEQWAVPLAGEVAKIARALLADSAGQKPEDGAAPWEGHPDPSSLGGAA